jgi:hypothetical protein
MTAERLLTEVYCPELAATSWDESIVLYSDRESGGLRLRLNPPYGLPQEGSWLPQEGSWGCRALDPPVRRPCRLLRLGRLFA